MLCCSLEQFTLFVFGCFWQNDLIHAWGLDMQLGYCAQAIPYCTTNFSFPPPPPPLSVNRERVGLSAHTHIYTQERERVCLWNRLSLYGPGFLVTVYRHQYIWR